MVALGVAVAFTFASSRQVDAASITASQGLTASASPSPWGSIFRKVGVPAFRSPRPETRPANWPAFTFQVSRI